MVDALFQTVNSVGSNLSGGQSLWGNVDGLTGVNAPNFGVVTTGGQAYDPTMYKHLPVAEGKTYQMFEYCDAIGLIPIEKVEHKPKVTVKALKEHIGRKFR